MTRVHMVLIAAVVITLGLWGCGREGSATSGSDEQMSSLQQKCAKLEKHCKELASSSEKLSQRVVQLEEERNRLSAAVEQYKKTEKECQSLRSTLVVRTAERDTAQAQFETLRKGIRSLLGQADAAMPEKTLDNTAAVVTPSSPRF